MKTLDKLRPGAVALSPDELKNRSKIILAIDDDADSLSMIGRIAGFAGYTFYGASSGEECVSLATRVSPRLILLDVQMPGIDGYETCRRLRGYPHLEHIPIAFLTACKTAEDFKKGMALGGNDFIIKPFDAVKLRERIQYWATRTIR